MNSTKTSQVSDTEPPTVPVIVALNGFFAVISPELLTVAMEVLEDFHVTVDPEGETLYLILWLEPIGIST